MLSDFNINLNVDLKFGFGAIEKLGDSIAKLGKVVMVVTCPWPEVQIEVFSKILNDIRGYGFKVVLFDKAEMNPTTISIDSAVEIARKEKVDVIVGLGGGSAIDTAKAISVGFAHEGSIWNYTYGVKNILPIYTERLLPVIAVTTTSGTGSHITPYSVIQNPAEHVKTCLYITTAMFPKVAIVDPCLMVTMPRNITANTGFDVFAHAFESYADYKSNVFIEFLALKAIELVVNNLKTACENGKDLKVRYNMAFADTLAGMCITFNNTTMPHDIGQAIIGKYPGISHGQSLAIVFPEYIDYAFEYSIDKFAKIARIFDESLIKCDDRIAASSLRSQIVSWQKEISIYASGKSLGIPEEIKEAVVTETMNNCEFLKSVTGQNKQEIEKIIDRIWNQD